MPAPSVNTASAAGPPGSTAEPRRAVIALVGNPNTGKTSLFNALTGFRRHVANYPGVTVETARGPVRGGGRPMELLDLPGTYSLAPVSPDERVVCEVLFGRGGKDHPRPDCVLAILDASNLQRNMYLVSQLLELDLPIVLALNMVDVAKGRGITVDAGGLSDRLGVPVVPVIATREETVKPLVGALEQAIGAQPPQVIVDLPLPLMRAARAFPPCQGPVPPAEALRVLMDHSGQLERWFLDRGGSADQLSEARRDLATAGVTSPADEVRARYAWITRTLKGVVTRPAGPVVTHTSRIDRVLTHQFAGGLVLLAVLAVVFQSIFTIAQYPMGWIEHYLFGPLGQWAASVIPAGVLRSLVVDGVIAGVGGVLVFLPQIMILFAMIAILEDCGYMSRAAYMMDRLMRALGLSGRAFIPLLSSFACAVPAIMGTRAIADRRERFVTILIAPFMSCSARLPVYVLLIAAFVPATTYLGGWVGLQGLVMFAMYLVGVTVAIPIAWLLKKTAFAGPKPHFLLELPPYRMPRLRAIWQRMSFGAVSFVKRAGGIILTVNLVVWALAYFPRDAATAQHVQQQATAAGWTPEQTDAELAGAYLRDSYLGRMGRTIEPVIKPIGWDWRVGMAVVASFPAREVIVATLGTIFNLGSDVDENSVELDTAMRQATWPDSDRPVFTLPVALSIMVFFALCAQCSSTLVIIGREMHSWRWPVVSFVGMTSIAYVAALLTAWLARAVLP